jgi:hypothetical protein
MEAAFKTMKAGLRKVELALRAERHMLSDRAFRAWENPNRKNRKVRT